MHLSPRLGPSAAAITLALSLNAAHAAPPKAADLPDQAPPFQGSGPSASGLGSLSHGSYRVLVSGMPTAGLTDCDFVAPVIIQSVQTYAFLGGICDDQGDTPCDGRLTLVAEFCGTESSFGAGGAEFDYRAATFHDAYASRICFDPTGDSTCAAPDSDSIVVGRIDTDAQRSVQFVAPGAAFGESDLYGRIVDTVHFEIEGRPARLSTAPYHSRVRFQRTGTGCGLPGQVACAQFAHSVPD